MNRDIITQVKSPFMTSGLQTEQVCSQRKRCEMEIYAREKGSKLQEAGEASDEVNKQTNNLYCAIIYNVYKAH